MFKKVLTFGTFDNLHPGHLEYLRWAQSKGNLYVVVARDANVQHIKHRAPEQSEVDRVAALQQAFPEAVVMLGHESDYLEPVRLVQPDLIVMGYDQKLPPTVSEEDLQAPIERAEPFKPEKYKSSLFRNK